MFIFATELNAFKMKTNKLYTVDKWNSPFLMPHREYYSNNQYTIGGWLGNMDNKIGGIMGGGQLAGSSMGGLVSGVAGAVGGLAGKALSGGYSSGAGNAIGSIGSALGAAAGAVNPVLGAAVSLGSQIVGGITNGLFGEKVDQAKLEAVNRDTSMLKNFVSEADTFDEVRGPDTVAKVLNPYSGGIFNSSAKKKNEALKRERAEAASWAARGVENNINNLIKTQMDDALASYAAYGGPLKYGLKPYATGGYLESNFLTDFSSNPLAAAMMYNQQLQAWDEQKEAEAAAALREKEYADMKDRLLTLETQNQGLQALLAASPTPSSLGLDIYDSNEYAPAPHNPETEQRVWVDDDEPTTKSKGNKKNWNYIEKELRKTGKFNDVQIAGIKLNLARESGFNPNAKGDNGRALGLGQWHPDRQPKDRSLAGQTQHFINTVLNFDGNKHWIGRDNYNGFLNARTPEEAHYYLAKGYERPAPYIMSKVKKDSDRSLGRLRAFGGELGTNGTDWTNGLLQINAGGSHEDNPLEGVPMGFDPEGVPNLVEEGETVWNDYVFSNRLKVPKQMKKKLGLGGSLKKDITFAEASKILGKESEQRPNDTMSIDGLNAAMSRLAEVQEAERMKHQMQEYVGLASYACGGKMKNKFSGLDNSSTLVRNTNPRKYDFSSFLDIIDNYKGSKKAGNLAGTYAIDPAFDFSPNTNIQDLENSDEYKNFTNTMYDTIKGLEGIEWDPNTYKTPDGKSLTPDQINAAKYLVYVNSVLPDSVESFYDDSNGVEKTFIKKGSADRFKGYRTDGKAGVFHLNPNRITDETIEALPYLYGETPIEATSITTPLNPMQEIARAKSTPERRVIVTDKGTNFGIAPTDTAPLETIAIEEGNTNPGIQKEVQGPPTLDTWLRYTPAFGSGLMALTDALGITNKPYYGYVDKLDAAANAAGYLSDIKYEPIGDYLTYRPMDIWYKQNRLDANSGATDRAIMNSGNTPARMAGLLANSYNSQLASGNLYRQALEYNDAQRKDVADYNRRTNMFNSQMGLEAAMANARYRQAAKQMQLSGLAQAAALRDSIDARVGAARSANITNFQDNLGNIGRENMAFNMINSTNAARLGYWIDKNGKVHYINKEGSNG